MPTSAGLPRGYQGKGIRVTSGDRPNVGDLGPAAILLAAGLIGLLIASFSGPGRNGQYLVIAAPWSNLGQTINLITAADGSFVAPGRFQNIAIAAPARAGFAERARGAGAWLVLPSPIATGCSSAQTEISPQ